MASETKDRILDVAERLFADRAIPPRRSGTSRPKQA